MRRLLCTAAVLALVTPQIASAQAQDRDKHHAQQAQQQPQQRRQQAARQQHAAAERTMAVRQQAARQQHGIAVHTEAVRQQGARQQRAIRARTEHMQQMSRQAQARHHAQRPAGYHPARIQRVHAVAFRYPRGYSYRRWNSGSVLPRLFLAPTYYYTNWYDLGFGPPPPRYRWVRYGPDLLLVNVYTGRIRDVVYGVFY